ncbi:DUF262 domain-containing protein [Edwardsiella anguillarum]|uniref:DUF262 domain-containing protein n=1 Tax=Edwardsiella anguillarum TaxID=1821960 RepID=UPI0024B7768D|nr:DUF262 domain-containing protein [Edwardsiella anguillarum]EKS7780433.1 DUF262 domain-containing protein [Edwardsiella piscicida]WHQ16393.1 DUF262 domain-containing protein [Edwardsiella anguillarum]WHQ19926.1 DUF262 domain-containing protein [Edwardsiella anguillarum]WHQ23448.1 DUF262 domain-containing protein [Edwardsiella anguillarum]WHQ27021.1 DUF262 domain-containing protein [Edwardsiella anguillarum]
MKNFDSRTYSINDFIEWYRNNQLELSPKFQRKSVWNDKARSYLMDTIISGKPIPKIFIRQRINAQTKKTIREVIDGQQRLRTILSYVDDGFAISPIHNKKYGGLLFSQLSDVDDDIQDALLHYEISTDLLSNLSDSDILDVFARLNSYSVILNTQEKLHANHFSEFKQLCERTAHIFNEFWIENKILTSQKILRMYDVELCSELYISILNGIQSKKQIEKYYKKYESSNTEIDIGVLEDRFSDVIDTISEIFNGDLKHSEFRRIQVFHSLFLAIYHIKYGIDGMQEVDFCMDDVSVHMIANRLERVDVIFEQSDDLNDDEAQFLADSRRATTDALVRQRRCEFLIGLMAG